MPIKTPDILPGEPGYISKKERTAAKKFNYKKTKKAQIRKEQTIGKIKVGKGGIRIGRPLTTTKKSAKYPIWRYGKKIGEILVKNKDKEDEEISLTFNRLGGIGNFKHLIQDADFQMEWAIREQELILTQSNCYTCKKKLSKAAKPNLYHYNMWNKRTGLIEKAQEVPSEVVKGKLSIEEGWKKFNNTLEEGNRYYMSLKDTALICAACAKQKGLQF